LASGSASHFIKLTGSGRLPTEARYGALAATLPSGQVLIAGGSVGPGPVFVSRSAELFNPATDTFKKLVGAHQSLRETRSGAVAATLPSGEVLIAGGEEHLSPRGPSAELFNPVTDTFTTLTGLGQSPIEPREGAVAATLPSGEVLIAGGAKVRSSVGYNGSPAPVGPLSSAATASAELFDPATDTFTKLTGNDQSPTEAREAAVAARLPSGQVLIAGGGSRTSMSSAELFNPARDTFSKLTGAGHSPTEARGGAVAAALADGQVLIAGGSNEASEGLSSAELFNPATGTFSKLTGAGQSPMQARLGAVAATLPSGEVLIAGVSDTSYQGLFPSSAELFVPAAQAARVLLVSCTPIAKTRQGKHAQVCTSKRPTPRVRLKASPVSAKASLTRAGIHYATGRLLLGNSSPRLVLDLSGRRTLRAGTYTLTLSWRTGKTKHTSRQRIMIE
jgi:hypothetical protein